MLHAATGPNNLEDLERRYTRATGDAEWWYLRVADSGDADEFLVGRATTGYLCWPEGFRRGIGEPGQLEWHPQHEEVFVLSGELHFENGASLVAPSYFNHPAFYLHPTRQRTAGSVTLLQHASHFPVVGFEEAPTGWDGVGYSATGLPTRSEAVDGRDLDSLPWVVLLDEQGERTGAKAKRVWDDLDHGWTTWVLQLPAGYDGPDMAPPPSAGGGGEEVFVVSGDLALGAGDDGFELSAGGHYCDPCRTATGRRETSRQGCVAIRWSRPADHLGLPPVGHALPR